MIGNTSIDLSFKNIWQSWVSFRKGKKATVELHNFQYSLEKNLFKLFRDLNTGQYQHGGYRGFIVSDNKRRQVSVASIKDRIVHRLIYDHLEKIYNKTFIFDAWSCRKNKGLLGAIERINGFCKTFLTIWKCDVKKFFDSVDQEILFKILKFRIKDNITRDLLKAVIFSFTNVPGKKIGMPIGNLTSQIFANIYLNELDRYVKHELKPKAYMRYGDDFILVDPNFEKIQHLRKQTINFLERELKLTVNPNSDKILKSKHGLKILGVKIWPSGRILNKRNLTRTVEKVQLNNISGYSGMINKHTNSKYIKKFSWIIYDKLLKDL